MRRILHGLPSLYLLVALNEGFILDYTANAQQESVPTPAQIESKINDLEAKLSSQRALLDAQSTEIEDLRETVRKLTSTLRSSTPETSTSGVGEGPGSNARQTQLPRQIGPSSTSPLSVRIGGALFTPFGFVDFTSIYRSTNVGSGSGTSFASIPFNVVPTNQFTNTFIAGGISETTLSAQNSRFGFRIDENFRQVDILGYAEADFVGAQPLDGIVTRTSNPLDVRLYYADLRWKKWEVLAGQAWSLLTPNRYGVSGLPSDVFYTVNLDTNYQVGLPWSRSPQIRFIYHPTAKWSVATSFENPQQYIGQLIVLPPNLSNYAIELNTTGSATNGTAVTTSLVPNLAPDIVAKIARDDYLGSRTYHIELSGLFRAFRVLDPVNLKSYNAQGLGASLNFNVDLTKRFNLIGNTFVSQGGGRFLLGIVPDVVARPNGSISPVRAYSTLDGFEYGLAKNDLLYGYYGLTYGQKDTSVDTSNPSLPAYGFGVPNTRVDNRVVSEITGGFDHTFWKSPYYGALQLNTQLSYVSRSVWDVTAAPERALSGPTNFVTAHVFMVFLNLRYFLP